MFPILFRIGNVEIPAYGVLSMLGILAGPFVFGRLVTKLGFDGKDAFWASLEAILVGFVASKIGGLAFQPAAGDLPFLQLLAKSGGVWYIGFLSGVAYAVWRFRSLNIPLLKALDCAAVGVAVGHAFGRLACFFAGCCWGGPCELPWAVTFTSERAHELVGVPLGVPLHPVQLYEVASELTVASIMAFIIVRRLNRFDLLPGLIYLTWYALARFGLEMLRDDPRGSAGIFTPSQLIALCVLAVAVPLLVLGFARGTIVPWRPRVPGGDAWPKAAKL